MNLEIDYNRCLALLDGKEVLLTPKEFQVASVLNKHRGTVVAHIEILKAVWGKGCIDDLHERQLIKDVINRLKIKLPNFIFNRRGFGYYMNGK